jgi:hypothetical protein
MKIIYVPAQVLTGDTTILRESIHRMHAEKVLSGIFEQDIVENIMHHLHWRKFPTRMGIIKREFCYHCKCWRWSEISGEKNAKILRSYGCEYGCEYGCDCIDTWCNGSGNCATSTYTRRTRGRFLYQPTKELLKEYGSLEKFSKTLNKATRIGEQYPNSLQGSSNINIYIEDSVGSIYLYTGNHSLVNYENIEIIQQYHIRMLSDDARSKYKAIVL